MRVIYGFNQIKRFRKPVVALGVFDGAHIAHRRILKEAVRKAKAIKGISVVVTFWPHPQQEKNLYSLEHRLKLIAKLDIDICIVIEFSYAFSQILAEDFIRDILIKRIGANYIYVGRNFRFGRGAGGDFKLLERLSHVYNFRLKAFEVIKIGRQPVSSTYIRRLIEKGKILRAKKLLGRPVAILGTVIKGNSLARDLGFPTANIDPHHEVLAPSGVYAVKIILGQKKFLGVCSIGSKPTFRTLNSKRPASPCPSGRRAAGRQTPNSEHVEVHIFNFRKNIYGKYLEIQFIQKLRNQKKFRSIPALARQIRKDIILAKRILAHH